MEPHSLHSLLQDRGIRPIDLAKSIKVDKSAITRWHQGRIPAERVLEIERATGIPRNLLRPDIYPPEQPATEAAA